jgi:2-methylcitrate dehydratase PrpD
MTTATTNGLTEDLALQVCGPAWRPDESGLDLAERALVDTVGVTLAAADDPTVQSLLDALGPGLGDGPCTVLVRGQRTDARTAALLGGTSAHALDFDDVDDAIIGHPSAVLVPTVLAAGEQVDADGPAVLDAYWRGLSATRMVAQALGISAHYAAGWHATATLGALGAAAAASRLLGLAPASVQHALGIAGSLAGGSRANFGTMTKPLHAGTAASNGLLAASLAAAGFTADPHQLESPLGFLALHAGERPDDHPHPVDPEAVTRPDVNVKLHPCCYYIHPAADAMLDLVEAGLSADDVAQVTVTVHPDGLAPLIHHRPRTGLQGKFSLEYAMAACLLDGALTLPTFTDSQVARPEAQRLLSLVEGLTSDTPPTGERQWSGSYATAVVRTRDGAELVRRVDRAYGHADRPLTETALRAKFDDCARFGGFAGATELYGTWRHARRLTSVRDATRRLCEARGHAAEVTA